MITTHYLSFNGMNVLEIKKKLVGVVASHLLISIHGFVVFNKLLPTVECIKRRV